MGSKPNVFTHAKQVAERSAPGTGTLTANLGCFSPKRAKSAAMAVTPG